MMDINYLAVVVAALSAFFLGYLWYTVIFAKVWQREIGMKDAGGNVQPPNLVVLLIGSLILEVLMALTLAMFIGKEADWSVGLVRGLAIGVGFVGFAFGVNYLFEGKTARHWLINASYNAVVFALMGLIIGAM
jgi:hypothetical protein